MSAARTTVLVIDDEPQIRRVVRNALQQPSTRIIEASTAAEGLDAAAAEQPALMTEMRVHHAARAYGVFNAGGESCRTRDCAVYATARLNAIAIPTTMNSTRRRMPFIAFHDG